MEPIGWVAVVAIIALLEYTVFVFLAGQSRGRHGVAAPSIIGHPDFERQLRVQYNTMEQLVIFLPALAIGGWHFPRIAIGLGIVFIVGRALYARAYMKDPAGRGPGFLLTLIANISLMICGLVGVIGGFR